jgi:hypothetical protein
LGVVWTGSRPLLPAPCLGRSGRSFSGALLLPHTSLAHAEPFTDCGEQLLHVEANRVVLLPRASTALGAVLAAGLPNKPLKLPSAGSSRAGGRARDVSW